MQVTSKRRYDSDSTPTEDATILFVAPLTAVEQATWQAMYRHHPNHYTRWRAHSLLLSHQGRSVLDIAAILERSISWTKVNLLRARNQLDTELNKVPVEKTRKAYG